MLLSSAVISVFGGGGGVADCGGSLDSGSCCRATNEESFEGDGTGLAISMDVGLDLIGIENVRAMADNVD